MSTRRPNPVAAADGESRADIAGSAGRPRLRRGRIAFLILAIVACAGFTALGVWQLQRLAWKHELIARVDARIHADAVPAPARSAWPVITESDHEYLRVRVAGHWLGEQDIRVQAVTRLGAGWWLLHPLRADNGDIVLVNRGFVPGDGDGPVVAVGAGEDVTVTGLLRMDEPDGGFLRENDPLAGRWFSRDVQAIATANGLGAVAPYFIDADHVGAPGQWPAGGLTVTRFPDNHLPYALTWFTLALLSAWGVWRVLREPVGRRRTRSEDASSGALDRHNTGHGGG